MIGLFLKKWFFDLWDNLFFALILNVVFSFTLAIPLLLPGLILPLSPLLGFATLMIGIIVLFFYGGIVNRYAWNMAKGETFRFADIGQHLKDSWKAGLVLGTVSAFLIVGAQVGLPFYASIDGFMAILALAFLFWLLVFWLLFIQYYFPLNAQIEKRIGKLFKKSALLFFDNPGFTIFMGIGSALILALSLVTLGLFPGFTGLLLWHQVGLKLRMYKYDHLETNPDTPRKKIPWEALLAEERDRVGKRTLKGMIFPWKD